MNGIKNIEAYLLNKYKETTPIIISILLALYIINVNNHYRIFLYEDDRLRNEIESTNRDYQKADWLLKKTYKNIGMIGRKLPLFSNFVSGNKYKILAIRNKTSDITSNNNLMRIINIINNEKIDINIIKLSNDIFANEKNGYLNSSGVSVFEWPAIVLLGDQNHILSIYSLDGTEVFEDLQLISKYLVEIVPDQYKRKNNIKERFQ